MRQRTPLAWKNLTYDLRRLAVAIGGVGFAVLLMVIELGFLNALLDSTVQVLQLMRGDLILVSKAKFSLPARERFPIRRVYQAQATEGVRAVYPVYMETLGALLRQRDPRATAKGHPIRVLAFREEDAVFELPPVEQYRDQLRRPGVALVDAASRAKFEIPRDPRLLRNYDGELSGKRIRFVGRFHLGVDFANEGNLLMTAANFANYFPYRAMGDDPLSVVDLAVIAVENQADADRVAQRLRRRLPDDVELFSKAAFIDRERKFWQQATPVGYIFSVGAIVGFIVGVVICYQIIYADIKDHIPEFATLKAMGYRNQYFVRMVLEQATYLSVLGFAPGCAGGWLAYQILAKITGLTMHLDVFTATGIFLATLTMCAMSGLLAVRKLLLADPAELF